MTNKNFTLLVVIGLVFIGIGVSAFTVNERELAIKLRVGEIVKSDYEPGLYWKIPVYETVRKFPARILRMDDEPQRVFTLERTAMEVDYFVQWKIVDSVQFYTSTAGSHQNAADRLLEIVRNSVVTEFGRRSVQEAISVEREELMDDMLRMAAATAQGLGIQVVDFRIKKVEFVQAVRDSVYRQMSEERVRVATEIRSQGRETAELIRSTADKDRTVLLAEAYREGQKIRGQGDARAAEIYANAYSKDPEFYAFYRSIDAYKKSVGQSGDVLVLDPNNEFFRYLNQSTGNQR